MDCGEVIKTEDIKEEISEEGSDEPLSIFTGTVFSSKKSPNSKTCHKRHSCHLVIYAENYSLINLCWISTS